MAFCNAELMTHQTKYIVAATAGGLINLSCFLLPAWAEEMRRCHKTDRPVLGSVH